MSLERSGGLGEQWYVSALFFHTETSILKKEKAEVKFLDSCAIAILSVYSPTHGTGRTLCPCSLSGNFRNVNFIKSC